MAHEHGAHECYCPQCGYTQTVDAYVKCNTIPCPNCGQQMRAVETGERRGVTGGITQEEPTNIFKTFGLAVLTGVGLGIGLYFIKKATKT